MHYTAPPRLRLPRSWSFLASGLLPAERPLGRHSDGSAGANEAVRRGNWRGPSTGAPQESPAVNRYRCTWTHRVFFGRRRLIGNESTPPAEKGTPEYRAIRSSSAGILALMGSASPSPWACSSLARKGSPSWGGSHFVIACTSQRSRWQTQPSRTFFGRQAIGRNALPARPPQLMSWPSRRP